jgi:hypothetical protein
MGNRNSYEMNAREPVRVYRREWTKPSQTEPLAFKFEQDCEGVCIGPLSDADMYIVHSPSLDGGSRVVSVDQPLIAKLKAPVRVFPFYMVPQGFTQAGELWAPLVYGNKQIVSPPDGYDLDIIFWLDQPPPQSLPMRRAAKRYVQRLTTAANPNHVFVVFVPSMGRKRTTFGLSPSAALGGNAIATPSAIELYTDATDTAIAREFGLPTYIVTVAGGATVGLMATVSPMPTSLANAEGTARPVDLLKIAVTVSQNDTVDLLVHLEDS